MGAGASVQSPGKVLGVGGDGGKLPEVGGGGIGGGAGAMIDDSGGESFCGGLLWDKFGGRVL